MADGTHVDGLHVENLTVRYGGLTAVDGQTLTAPRGRITGLIGPNGAGKTTTFNAITGVVKPAQGKVVLFGEDVTSAAPQARALEGTPREVQTSELVRSAYLGSEAPELDALTDDELTA